MRISLLFDYELNLIAILTLKFQNVYIPLVWPKCVHIEFLERMPLYVVFNSLFLTVSRADCARIAIFTAIVCHCQI